jgi:hypothetical protein
MKKQIDDIGTRVTGALSKLREDITTWKGKIETMQANLITLQEKSKKFVNTYLYTLASLVSSIFFINSRFV